MKFRRDLVPSIAAVLLLGLATALSCGWPAGTKQLAAAPAERGCVL